MWCIQLWFYILYIVILFLIKFRLTGKTLSVSSDIDLVYSINE